MRGDYVVTLTDDDCQCVGGDGGLTMARLIEASGIERASRALRWWLRGRDATAAGAVEMRARLDELEAALRALAGVAAYDEGLEVRLLPDGVTGEGLPREGLLTRVELLADGAVLLRLVYGGLERDVRTEQAEKLLDLAPRGSLPLPGLVKVKWAMLQRAVVAMCGR